MTRFLPYLFSIKGIIYSLEKVFKRERELAGDITNNMKINV